MKIAQEANLQAIIAHFDGYLWSMDKDRHYIILNTTVTEKIKELTGLDVKPGDPVQDFPGSMDPSMTPVWEKICGLGLNGESIRMIREFRVKGQPAFFELSVIPIRKGQEVLGISCFIKDLTTETLTSRQVQTSEARFRSLIENGADIIVVVDGEGKIVYGSPSIEHYFGVTDAENLGKNAFEYVHPEDLSRLAESFMDVLGEPGRAVTVEARAVLKDKTVIWVEGTVTNLLASEGINGIVCNFRDVTVRKNAERQAKEWQKQLLQATIDAQEKEREDIGRELHDNVNQILTTARLYLDCINDADAGQQGIIRRSSDIISTAIEEIRKLSRSMTQSFHREVGLRLSVEDLIESIRRLAEGVQISLDFYLPEEVFLDDKLKTTLFRILQEQLNNVLKHAAAENIRVSLRQEGEELLLLIADDGKGFDAGKKREGIGINNIINRAEVFRGHVTLDTAPGKGCSLSVLFPLPAAEKKIFAIEKNS